MSKEIEIVTRNIGDLIGAEYNPRKLSDKQKEDLSDSLKRFGFVDPILVNMNEDRKNIVIGGHSRLKVAKELGIKKVPCVELDLTLEQEKELNIRLNKNSGEFDFDKLEEFFEADALVDWGFEEVDFDKDWDDLDYIEEADEVELEKDSVIKILVEKEYADSEDEVRNKIKEILENYNGITIQ